MEKYSIACIGAGSISREFSLRYLNASPFLEVCAIVDLDLSAAQNLARDVAYRRAGAAIIGGKYRETVDENSISDDMKRHLPQVLATTSVDEALRVADCVYIATPPLSHATLTIQALSANKHVILEKPLAVSVEDCNAIVAAAEDGYASRGLIVTVNIGMRHNLALHELGSRIKDSSFGDISRITIKNHYIQWPRVWQEQPWVAQRAQGGPLLEVGTHWIFGLLELVGHSSVQSTYSSICYPVLTDDTGGTESLSSSLCESSCRGTISLRSGVDVEVDILSTSAEAIAAGKDIYEMTIYGSRTDSNSEGSHYVGESSLPALTLYDFTKLRDDVNGGVDIVPLGGSYGRMECVNEFIKAIRHGSRDVANLVSPAHARNVAEIITLLKKGGNQIMTSNSSV